MTDQKEQFQFIAKIRDKNIKFRKWKVKDKNKFISAKDDQKSTKEALVYDCLQDKKIALSEDEYKYLLIKIRETSLPDKIHYVFECSSCKENFNYEADLVKIMHPQFQKYSKIEYAGHKFEITGVRNREFYDNAVLNCSNDEERFMIDFILHIKSYNDNDGLSFKDLNDIIDNLDVNDFENLYNQWEQMRFKVQGIADVKCPHCSEVEAYEFDDLPGFFPDSWNI